MITDTDDIHHSIIEKLGEFLSDYYRDEIGQAIQHGEKSITVEYADLFQFDPDLANDYINTPDILVDHMDRATYEVDIPVPGSDEVLEDLTVRMGGVDVENVTVNTLREDHRGRYLGLRGQVSRASQVQPRTVRAVFRCENCSSPEHPHYLDPIPQHGEEIQMPRQCPG